MDRGYSSFDLDRVYLQCGAALREAQMVSMARRGEFVDLLSGGRRELMSYIEVL